MDQELDKNNEVFSTELEQLKKYEFTFITKNEDFSPVKAVILKHQGAITQEKTPQKISLSYPIKKQEQGFMGTMSCMLAPEILNSVSNDLNLEESVLRFMFNKPDRDNSADGVIQKNASFFDTTRNKSERFFKISSDEKNNDNREIAKDKKISVY